MLSLAASFHHLPLPHFPTSRPRMVLTDSFPCMILHRRNLACRGCGCPRSENQPSTMQRQGSGGPPASRLPASPRFVNSSGHPPMLQSPLSPPVTSPLYHNVGHNVRQGSAPQPSMTGAKPPSPTHPLLTPSGRSFAVGGKVHNVSSDPLSPCIMYWPDNEPFPEQGQIRPSSLMVAPVSSTFYDPLMTTDGQQSLAASDLEHRESRAHRASAW